MRLRAQEVAFLKEKHTSCGSAQKTFAEEVLYAPPKYDKNCPYLPPKRSAKRYPSHFRGFFSLAKRIPRSERNEGKRKRAFFFPHFSRTGGEAKASPPKMTQHTAVPPRKVFAELFSKSDPFARRRPQATSNISQQKQEPNQATRLLNCVIII
jgi:hypothetical protein